MSIAAVVTEAASGFSGAPCLGTAGTREDTGSDAPPEDENLLPAGRATCGRSLSTWPSSTWADAKRAPAGRESAKRAPAGRGSSSSIAVRWRKRLPAAAPPTVVGAGAAAPSPWAKCPPAGTMRTRLERVLDTLRSATRRSTSRWLFSAIRKVSLSCKKRSAPSLMHRAYRGREC